MTRGEGAEPHGPAGGRPHRVLTDVFVALGRGPRKRVSVGDIDESLRGRSFGPLLMAFAVPNLLPFPFGTSTILGLPLLFVAWQLAIGRTEIWMPKVLSRQSVSRARYRRLLARAMPWLRWTERMMRPRRWPFPPDRGDQVVGLIAIILAVLVVLPVPFANWLPAVACFCVGVGLTARDGYWLGAGVLLGAISLAVFVAIVLLTFLAVEAVVVE